MNYYLLLLLIPVGLVFVYVIFRLLSKAIFKSYFEDKLNYWRLSNDKEKRK